jgi:hypothetical protein
VPTMSKMQTTGRTVTSARIYATWISANPYLLIIIMLAGDAMTGPVVGAA